MCLPERQMCDSQPNERENLNFAVHILIIGARCCNSTIKTNLGSRVHDASVLNSACAILAHAKKIPGSIPNSTIAFFLTRRNQQKLSKLAVSLFSSP